ncbi:MAG: hypothetical protein ACTSV2_08795 [Candidatus Thorarchaeota archaeon]
MDYKLKAHLVIQILVILTLASIFSITVEDAAANGLNIIDEDYEGILPDTTQYFAIANHGSSTQLLQVNISALEFVGATGYPDFELAVYDFDDRSYSDGYLAICNTDDNYTCRLFFIAESDESYVVAVTNLDKSDDAIYNITIRSKTELDFQYTTMFDMDDFDSGYQNTIAITYFESASPYLFRIGGYSDTRVIVEWTNLGEEEYYFFIYNKGETCEMFVGLIGFPFYSYYAYPMLTAVISDFEDLDAGSLETETDLFTISNSSVGRNFTCESEHRYRFWIDVGSDEPTVYFIFDTYGETELDFRQDIFTDNPEDKISLVPSRVDPWIEFRNLTRDSYMWIFGVGGATVTGILFTVWFLRKRYY